jgi:hypothetical protein
MMSYQIVLLFVDVDMNVVSELSNIIIVCWCWCECCYLLLQ